MITWKEPENAQRANERADILRDEISKIDLQLSQRGRIKNGRPMSEEEYEAWRRSAKHAKAIKSSEYRFLKNWVHQHPDVWTDKIVVVIEQLLESASQEGCTDDLVVVSSRCLDTLATLIREH